MFGVEISDEAVTGLFTDVSLSPKVTPIGSNSTLYEVYNLWTDMFIRCHYIL